MRLPVAATHKSGAGRDRLTDASLTSCRSASSSSRSAWPSWCWACRRSRAWNYPSRAPWAFSTMTPPTIGGWFSGPTCIPMVTFSLPWRPGAAVDFPHHLSPGSRPSIEGRPSWRFLSARHPLGRQSGDCGGARRHPRAGHTCARRDPPRDSGDAEVATRGAQGPRRTAFCCASARSRAMIAAMPHGATGSGISRPIRVPWRPSGSRASQRSAGGRS